VTLVLRLSLDDCGVAEERVVPPEAWCEEGGVVRVHGVGLVQGGHGVKRVPVRRTTMLACQRCKQLKAGEPPRPVDPLRGGAGPGYVLVRPGAGPAPVLLRGALPAVLERLMTMPKRPDTRCCRCFRGRVRTRCSACSKLVCGRLSCSASPPGGARACLECLPPKRDRRRSPPGQ
jgi:hypothetical protein